LTSDRKRCDPSCEFFRCEQRAITKEGTKIFCNWGEDECRGPSCNYGLCVKGKMLANGICGLTIRRKTKGVDEEEIDRIQGIKIRGRLSSRLKEKELY
jgi:hypothetical protein